MKPPFPLHGVVLVVTAIGAASLFACTAGSRGDDTTATPTTAGPKAGTGGAVDTPQGASPGCEELGTLSATALTGTLDTAAESQTTSFTLPNRPVTTKVKVVAVGSASDLIGKSAVLGASVDANYATCTHCLVVAIGCTASSCANAAVFFPRTGTGTFTAVAAKGGQPFSGTFSDVELEQVSVDTHTFVSTPIVNGACMHVSALSFGSTPSGSSEPVDGGGGTSASSTGGVDGGNDTGVKFDGGIVKHDGGGMSSTSSGGDSSTKTL